MTLSIDWTRCDGHSLCAALLPGRITLDDWGFPLITDGQDPDPDRDPDNDERRAVLACPALALRLERSHRGRRLRPVWHAPGLDVHRPRSPTDPRVPDSD
jgi:ferredoxin